MQDIIKKPIVNEKFSALNEKGVYGFVVDKTANKLEIGQAIEKLFGVKVSKVNTMNVRGKSKSRFQRGRFTKGTSPSYKKAIVYLKEGEVIDFYSGI
jgi:large subunit ribosomal protein L23